MSKKYYRKDKLCPNDFLIKNQILQIRQYLNQQADKPQTRLNRMIIDLLLNTGLRAAEVCSLQIKDLPGYHGHLTIFICRGKGGKPRSVDISAALSKRLVMYIEIQRQHSKPNDFLFVNERNGRQLSYRSLYSKLKIIGQHAGLPWLHPHLLRHTYAMALYALRNDLRGVQVQLGHNSPTTTSIYANTENEALRQQIETLDL